MLSKQDKKTSITHRVKSVTQDEYGGEIIVWVDTAVYYGSIKRLSASQLYASERDGRRSTHRVYIDVDNPISPGDTLVINDGVYIVIYSDNVMDEGRLWQIDVLFDEDSNA